MANNYFQFKQFRVDQNNEVFRVGTDGCLLGALAEVPKENSRILDIGTGTGLISLMLAQRYPTTVITAIEIMENAFQVAVNNFKQSPWSMRIKASQKSLQQFSADHKERFDLIVSNPPYFNRSLPSPDETKRTARHDQQLSLSDLFYHANRLLSEDGRLDIIIPSDRCNEAKLAAKKVNLKLRLETKISSFPNSSPKRVLLSLDRSTENLQHKSLSIYEKHRVLSTEMTQLMTPFYLKL